MFSKKVTTFNFNSEMKITDPKDDVIKKDNKDVLLYERKKDKPKKHCR